MSQQIDSFCEKLRGKLNEMDDRLQQLKASAKADSEKARQDLHSQAEKLRASLDADHASIEAAKTRMKDWAAGKKATFDEKVAQWKVQRKQEQLKRRAEAAEEYASDAFDVAVAAVDDAYEAALEALASLSATELTGSVASYVARLPSPAVDVTAWTKSLSEPHTEPLAVIEARPVPETHQGLIRPVWACMRAVLVYRA